MAFCIIDRQVLTSSSDVYIAQWNFFQINEFQEKQTRFDFLVARFRFTVPLNDPPKFT